MIVGNIPIAHLLALMLACVLLLLLLLPFRQIHICIWNTAPIQGGANEEEEEDDEEGCAYTPGSTLLILAARRGHKEVVRWLLQHKGM